MKFSFTTFLDDQSGGVPKRIQAMNEESCIIGLSVPVIGKGEKLHGRLANHKPQKKYLFLAEECHGDSGVAKNLSKWKEFLLGAQ